MTFQLLCGGWISNSIYRQKIGLAIRQRLSTRRRWRFDSESYNSGKTERADALRQQVVDEPYAKRPNTTDRQPVQRQLLKGDTGRRAIENGSEKGGQEPNYAR